MDRCALFVDAGYLLADGAMAVHGTRHRETVSWDFGGLLQLLGNLARERTGIPLLRCYWYEATAEGRRAPEHEALADLPGLKLRLGRIRPGRREGVDTEIHRDLMTLARNGALADAVLVSGDEDLAQVVVDAQDFGVRVTVVHVTVDGNWTIARTLRQECDDLIEIGSGHLRPYVNLLAGVEGGGRESGGGHSGLDTGGRDTGGRENPAIEAPGAGQGAGTSSGTGGAIGAIGSGPGSGSGSGSASGSGAYGAGSGGSGASSSPGHHAPVTSPLSNGHGNSGSLGPLHTTGPHNAPPPSTPLTGPPPSSAPLAGQHGLGSGYGSDGGSSPGYTSDTGSGYGTGHGPGSGSGPGSAASGAGYEPGSNPGYGSSGMSTGTGGYGSGTTGTGYGSTSNPGPSPGTTGSSLGNVNGSTMGTGAYPVPSTGGNTANGVGPGPGHSGAPPAQPHVPPQAPSPSAHSPAAPSPSTTSPTPLNAAPTSGPSTTGPIAAPSQQHGHGTGPHYLPSSPPQPPTHQPPGPYTGPQQIPRLPAVQQSAPTLADAVKAAHQEGQDFGESVARDAPALWLEAVLARKPRMPSDLEARLLQGSSLPIDFLLHDEVRHALRRGFWDALERSRR